MLAVQRFSATGAIDAAFRIYRRHFVPLFLLSLVVGIPSMALSVLRVLATERSGTWLARLQSGDSSQTALVLLGFVALMFLGVAVVLVTGVFGLAGATRIASMAALGRDPTLNDAVAESVHVFWPLLGASLLAGLAAFAGFLFLVVPGFIVYFGLIFVAPVVVIERVNAADALARSWALTRGRRLKIFLALILVAFIFVTVAGGALMVSTIVGFFTSTLVRQIVQELLSQSISVLAGPIWYVTIVMLYYDARVEHEAFDVEMLAKAALQP